MPGVMLVGACGSGPPPKLYLLEPHADLRQEQPAKPGAMVIKSLGMSAVTLPGYASSTQIASLNNNGTVVQNDRHRWAEEPEDAITRVLADRLRNRSGGAVLVEPWPRDYDPSARIEVVFDRLLREPLGGVDMTGQILLLSGDGRDVIKILPFHIIHYGRDPGQAVYFLAVSQGIDDIARMAINALTQKKNNE